MLSIITGDWHCKGLWHFNSRLQPVISDQFLYTYVKVTFTMQGLLSSPTMSSSTWRPTRRKGTTLKVELFSKLWFFFHHTLPLFVEFNKYLFYSLLLYFIKLWLRESRAQAFTTQTFPKQLAYRWPSTFDSLTCVKLLVKLIVHYICPSYHCISHFWFYIVCLLFSVKKFVTLLFRPFSHSTRRSSRRWLWRSSRLTSTTRISSPPTGSANTARTHSG